MRLERVRARGSQVRAPPPKNAPHQPVLKEGNAGHLALLYAGLKVRGRHIGHCIPPRGPVPNAALDLVPGIVKEGGLELEAHSAPASNKRPLAKRSTTSNWRARPLVRAKLLQKGPTADEAKIKGGLQRRARLQQSVHKRAAMGPSAPPRVGTSLSLSQWQVMFLREGGVG